MWPGAHPPSRDSTYRGYECLCVSLLGGAQSPFRRKEHPSVSRALPPVGTHSTVLQLGHTTTVCEWLNTVVLQSIDRRMAVCQRHCWIEDPRLNPPANHHRQAGCPCAHMVKQPWHFTSMKYELGDSTNRLSLWLCFSTSAGGCSRSMSHESTCAKYQQVLSQSEGANAIDDGGRAHALCPAAWVPAGPARHGPSAVRWAMGCQAAPLKMGCYSGTAALPPSAGAAAASEGAPLPHQNQSRHPEGCSCGLRAPSPHHFDTLCCYLYATWAL